MSGNAKPKLLIIVGPTGSGKSKIAIQTARRLKAEIISADSRYLFQELNIGTDKPTASELDVVPHHLINETDLSNPWSLGKYLKVVHNLILQINERGNLPILAGGTGQYIRAIRENWQIPAKKPDVRMRIALEHWGQEKGFDALHQKLALIDPEAAKLIDFRNKRRTVRALEVILTTGRHFSEQRRSSPTPYNILTVGLSWDRDALYARIDERIEAMITNGLIEEVAELMQAGFTDQLLKIGVIGYTEIIQFLRGAITLEEAIAQIKHNTRVFVRHQANWFKPTDPGIYWLNAQDPANEDQILGLVKRYFFDQAGS